MSGQLVPDGFNIFALLNVSFGGSEDDQEENGWTIVMNDQKPRFKALQNIFEVSFVKFDNG